MLTYDDIVAEFALIVMIFSLSLVFTDSMNKLFNYMLHTTYIYIMCRAEKSHPQHFSPVVMNCHARAAAAALAATKFSGFRSLIHSHTRR